METSAKLHTLWQNRFTSIITFLVLAFLLFVAAVGNYILFSTC